MSIRCALCGHPFYGIDAAPVGYTNRVANAIGYHLTSDCSATTYTRENEGYARVTHFLSKSEALDQVYADAFALEGFTRRHFSVCMSMFGVVWEVDKSPEHPLTVIFLRSWVVDKKLKLADYLFKGFTFEEASTRVQMEISTL